MLSNTPESAIFVSALFLGAFLRNLRIFVALVLFPSMGPWFSLLFCSVFVSSLSLVADLTLLSPFNDSLAALIQMLNGSLWPKALTFLTLDSKQDRLTLHNSPDRSA